MACTSVKTAKTRPVLLLATTGDRKSAPLRALTRPGTCPIPCHFELFQHPILKASLFVRVPTKGRLASEKARFMVPEAMIIISDAVDAEPAANLGTLKGSTHSASRTDDNRCRRRSRTYPLFNAFLVCKGEPIRGDGDDEDVATMYQQRCGNPFAGLHRPDTPAAPKVRKSQPAPSGDEFPKRFSQPVKSRSEPKFRFAFPGSKRTAARLRQLHKEVVEASFNWAVADKVGAECDANNHSEGLSGHS
ncbi:hypothetical protein GGX14DRAFT_389691 [Mycena pura]|uniref:Uncharacterized protein n=1 Tax=Mycena pura TaxID=153505 RepID=A0AAD6VS64_9AGAR|nr:hypothetical protein GGX14DRAFT_389691 [Mycena pura]